MLVTLEASLWDWDPLWRLLISLGMSVSEFLDEVNWGREAHLTFEHTTLYVLGSRLNKQHR